MNDSKGDTWYQAVLQLDEKERVAAPKYLPIGPPRRLVADILLDLTRNVETAKKQKISSFYDSHEGVVWPRAECGRSVL